MTVIDNNTSAIRTRLEKLYENQKNLIEIPDLNRDPEKEKSKIFIQTIEKSFPGYELKIPTVQGTLEYREIPKLIYDTSEKKYFLEISREIKFSENLPFKSLQLSIKLNYYQIIVKSILLASLLTMLFFIPLIIIFSRTVISPILKLSKASKEIASGNLSVYIDYNSKDEIGELANSFNSMSKELVNIKRIRDDLLASISHEIRSPLGRIRGYTELFFDLKLDKREKEDYYKSILQEVDFINGMVGEIIEISRLELGKEELFKEDIDFGYLFEIIEDDLQIRKNIQNVNYIFNYEKNLFCSVDVDKIRRVIQNIIDNSIKAKSTEIKISALKKDSNLEVIIKDNGVGIPEEHMEIVFEKFYRVDKSRDRKTGGFGLGLAICKGIILGHNGQIYFTKSDSGAELHILLPLINLKDSVV
ncbi:MAG TPA: HAMP domain-containing sensor histidine kinase [Spirochaetota bacterium]|nr:HAMP domain-containing sensor histidine kinase [Spirochaetota bacterium]